MHKPGKRTIECSTRVTDAETTLQGVNGPEFR